MNYNRVVRGGIINTFVCTGGSFFQCKVRLQCLHNFSRNMVCLPLCFSSCVWICVLQSLIFFWQGYLLMCGNWDVLFVPSGFVLEKKEACWHNWQCMICRIPANLCSDCAVDSTWAVFRVYADKRILLENDTTISLYFRAKAVALSRFPDM